MSVCAQFLEVIFTVHSLDLNVLLCRGTEAVKKKKTVELLDPNLQTCFYKQAKKDTQTERKEESPPKNQTIETILYHYLKIYH